MSSKNDQLKDRKIAARNRRNFGRIFLIFVGLIFVLIIFSFFVKAIFKTADGQNLANRTGRLYNQTTILKAQRGKITDSKGHPLAEDSNTYSLYAVIDKKQKTSDGKPDYVKDPKKTADVLSQNLHISKKNALKTLTPKKKAYQVEFGNAGNNISLTTKQHIQAQHLSGLHFISKQARLYPNGIFASHIVGLASSMVNPKTKHTSLVGQMGIERAFNKFLAGKNGVKTIQHDNYGYQLPSGDVDGQKRKNGDNVHTTIDPGLELLLENQMNKVDSEVHPKVLNAMLMDAKTGEVVAAAQRPSFNPETGKGLGGIWRNTLTQDTYEPGSTMKIFTMAASIDSGNYKGSDTYQSGVYKFDGQKVPDWKIGGWGTIDFNKGFALSSNVAMAHLEQNMGAKTWKKYIDKFQLLKHNTSNIDTQTPGSIQFQRPIEQADTAFGQGIEVTAIQMMQGFSAIANHGQMIQPRFISKVTDAKNKKTIKKYPKKVVGQPIKASTATSVRKHMEDVVYKDYGIGQDFKIKGYRVAAKTGTAQVTGANGKYENGDNSYIYSVAGMVPAKNPRYVMYVTMKQPKLGSNSPTKVLAQIFNVVMKKALVNQKAKHTHARIPDLVNMKTTDAQTELNNKKIKNITVGNGQTIKKQFPAPKAPTDIASQVILVTDGKLTMPDMTGWSREDVQELCNLLKIQVNFSGDGKVKDQTIKPGQEFSMNTHLDVALLK